MSANTLNEKLQILVVDDEPELGEALSGLFRGGGFAVKSAASAEAALEIVRREHPPLIFCDIAMPGKSGLEFLGDLRRLGGLGAVVMLTAYSDHIKVVEALRLGAVDYVTKPFDFRQLLARTAVWLELGVRLASLSEGDCGVQDVKAKLRMIDLFRVKSDRMGNEDAS